ncbi:MAG: hypothetical protein GU361_05820 [Desulfurococcales archaeon]|uniref:Uncharacterized protein n=1 Tax=Fervidicoccus fontis TaxID=683846 RepID=A0A7C1E949_9CREN|nr:hypothetical protein [Desulfurococcales archaeon]
MPTIHISVPDKLYQELKEVSENYDIQITDLIKILIKNYLPLVKQGYLSSPDPKANESYQQLQSKLETLEKRVNELDTLTRSFIRASSLMLQKLEEKIDKIEEDVYDLKVERKVSKIIEPELLNK